MCFAEVTPKCHSPHAELLQSVTWNKSVFTAVSSFIFTSFWLQETKVMQETSCSPAQKHRTRFPLPLLLTPRLYLNQNFKYTFPTPHLLPRFCISMCISEAEMSNTLKDPSVQLETKNPSIVAFVSAHIKGHFSKPLYYKGFLLLVGSLWQYAALWIYRRSLLSPAQCFEDKPEQRRVRPSTLLTTETRVIMSHKPQIHPVLTPHWKNPKQSSIHTESTVTNWDPPCGWTLSNETSVTQGKHQYSPSHFLMF